MVYSKYFGRKRPQNHFTSCSGYTGRSAVLPYQSPDSLLFSFPRIPSKVFLVFPLMLVCVCVFFVAIALNENLSLESYLYTSVLLWSLTRYIMNRHKGSKRSQSSSWTRKRFTGTRPSEMRSNDQADRSSCFVYVRWTGSSIGVDVRNMRNRLIDIRYNRYRCKKINRRVVFVMRILGVAREGLNIFCNLMDISAGLSQSAYDKIMRHVHTAATTMFEKFTKKATEEEKTKNIENGRPENDFKVSGDRLWKKRGFTSLYGVTTIIGYYTAKVLDAIVKSSFCTACSLWGGKKDTIEYAEWYENHQESCSQNYQGSAG